MSKYFISKDPIERKKRIIYGFVFILLGVFYIVLGSLEDNYGLRKFSAFLFAFSGIWSGIEWVRPQKDLFITVNEEKIEWLVEEKFFKVISIEWLDIRWIKKELEGGVTIFRDSSFSHHMTMKKFSEQDIKDIEREIIENAIVREIRLINFSDKVAVVV